MHYACVNCRTRKKSCDKKLPSCSYCTQRLLVCHYPTAYELDASRSASSASADASDSSTVLSDEAKSALLLVHSLTGEASSLLATINFSDTSFGLSYQHIVHMRVNRLMQAAGLSVLQVWDNYMAGLHQALPIVDVSQLKTYETMAQDVSRPPLADLSMLVLSLSLLAVDGGAMTGLVRPASFYMTAKILFTQLQVQVSPSLAFVQAGTILAVYELKNGWGKTASVSISACGQMFSLCSAEDMNAEAPLIDQFRKCVSIVERVIRCDLYQAGITTSYPLLSLDTVVQPLQRGQKSPDVTGRSHRVSNRFTSQGLDRTVHAAYLLDEVVTFSSELRQASTSPQPESATLLEEHLSTFLQDSIALDALYHDCCSAVATAVCAMFIFHDSVCQSSSCPELELLRGRSEASLHTCVALMMDLAAYHAQGNFAAHVDAVPLCCTYSAHFALSRLVKHHSEAIDPRQETAREQLRNLINFVDHSRRR